MLSVTCALRLSGLRRCRRGMNARRVTNGLAGGTVLNGPRASQMSAPSPAPAARRAASTIAAPAAPDADDGFDVCGPPRLHGVPFSGRARFTMLSHLDAAHSSGGGLFAFMTMAESNKVRVQSREAREAVMRFEWMSEDTMVIDTIDERILGDVAAWRAAFPAARVVNVSKRVDLRDADFVHIRGGPGVRLHAVNMSGCTGVTDAAFAHLAGIHTLKMDGCNQEEISDAAFAHLAGICDLDMSGCDQSTITDAAFAHLDGVNMLDMSGCNQEEITDAAFAHIAGVGFLVMSGCDQITDEAFVHLRGIYALWMNYCNQNSITDAAFAHLGGINTLSMNGCDQDTITPAAFAHLAGIRSLFADECAPAVAAAAAALLARGAGT